MSISTRHATKYGLRLAAAVYDETKRQDAAARLGDTQKRNRQIQAMQCQLRAMEMERELRWLLLLERLQQQDNDDRERLIALCAGVKDDEKQMPDCRCVYCDAVTDGALRHLGAIVCVECAVDQLVL